ncbi:MAG: hypothetical protein ABEJ88_05705 [Halobacterium sp.]
MPSRRRFLSGVAAGAAVLAGCTGRGTPDEPNDPQTTRTTDSTTDSTSDPTTEPTTETTRERAVDDTKYDRVVVENRSDRVHRVTVTVSRDGDVLHEGTYRVPVATGLRIERKLDWGTHTVTAAVDGGDARTETWEHGSCASTPHSDGNQNLGVVVSDEGWEFVENGCDYLKLGETYVGDYEPAAEHEVDATTATTA